MKKHKGRIISFVLFALVFLGFAAVPQVLADPIVHNVEPGTGTLKKALEDSNVNDGDIFILREGSYSGVAEEPVKITKAITLQGVGSNYRSNRATTTINVPIEIDVESPEKTVTLKGISSGIQSVSRDYMFVKVNSPVHLIMDDVSNWGILRGESNGKFGVHEATSLKVEQEADGSNIEIKNSRLSRAGTHYGINILSSNTTVTVNDSEIHGRTAINLESGSGNNITINNTGIEGRSIYYADAMVVNVKEQNNLTMNLNNVDIVGTYTQDGNPDQKESIFAFSNNNTVNLSLSEVTIEDRSKSSESVIFDFGDNATSQNIQITDNATKYLSTDSQPVTLDHKYSKGDTYAVVGTYDFEGNGEINIHAGNTEISELENPKYITKENYNFKGWFKNFDGTAYSNEYTKAGESYPQTVAGTNMDLYAKLVKVLKVKITGIPKDGGTEDKEFNVEEGETLEQSASHVDIKDALDKIKTSKPDQTFQGYIVYNDKGAQTYKPEQEDVLFKELSITQDCQIEAIHQVKVTINGTEFFINSGQTLKDLKSSNPSEYDTAKMLNSKNREFSRFVDAEGQEVSEEKMLTANVELTSKFLVKVTIASQEYSIEEGQKLNSKDDIKEALESLKTVEGKRFGRFVINNEEINPDNKTLTEDATITAIYVIQVTIGESDSYTIDEGKNLNSLTAQQEEIKGKIKALENTVPMDQSFKGIAVFDTENGQDRKLYQTSQEKNIEAIAEEIMNETFSKDTKVMAEYNVKVTIKGAKEDANKTFEVEIGSTLEDLTKDANASSYKEAKYRDKDEDRFSRFIDEESHTFEENKPIDANVTLTPIYFVKVTISGSQYLLEENQTIDDFTNEDAKAALAKLRTDKTDEDSNINLHFEKLVLKDSTDQTVDDKYQITKDIEIIGIYHYDVKIHEDYKDETEDKVKRYNVLEGKNLSEDDQQEAISTSLEALKNSTTASNQQFYKFYDLLSSKEYTEEELLNTIFNTHIDISAKVSYKVTIGETSEFIPEGMPLSSNQNIMDALNALKETSDKKFSQYKVNGDLKDISGDTIVNEPMTITAAYNVLLTIGEETFEIPENGKITDYNPQEKITSALDNLKTQVTATNHNFKGYYYTAEDGNHDIDVAETTFAKNTTILAKYNIKITIKGITDDQNKDFELDSNQTLKDIKEQSDYQTVTSKADRTFAEKFRDEDGNIVTEETPFEENAILTPIFNVKVSINDTDYYLEEGTELGTPEIKAALEVFEKEDKQVHGYVYGESTPITLTDKVNDNITIKPVYYVRLTIQYGSETIGIFEFPENKSIADLELATKTPIQNALTTLKSKVTADDYNFKKYVSEDNTEFTESTTVTKNTTVTAQYNIQITIEGANGTETFEIDSNGTLENVKQADSTKFENVQKKSERTFLYFEVQDENKTQLKNDDNTYQFTKNTKLVSKYAVTVKIDTNDYQLLEGTKLSSNADIVTALKQLEKPNKHLVSYSTDKGQTITVEDLNNKTDSVINDNVTITPKYMIDIVIEGAETFTKTVEENTTLGSIDYTKPTNFKKFVDYETGLDVLEETPLTENTKVKAIYGIKVIANGHEYELDSFQTFGDLSGADDDLDVLKEVPAGKVAFSRFVYINGQGVEIELKPDTILTTDITVVPKYTIELTIVYTDDKGEQVELVKLELEEGKTINDLSEEELTKLNTKIKEREEELEKEGKHDFKFTKFTIEGEDVDVSIATFEENTILEAIFEYKKETVPEKPEEDYPFKEPAPNTGVTTTTNNTMSIPLIILAIVGILGFRKKLFNR